MRSPQPLLVLKHKNRTKIIKLSQQLNLLSRLPLPKQKRSKPQQQKLVQLSLTTPKWQNCVKSASVLLVNVKQKKNKAKPLLTMLMTKSPQLLQQSRARKRKKLSRKKTHLKSQKIKKPQSQLPLLALKRAKRNKRLNLNLLQKQLLKSQPKIRRKLQ